MPSQAALHPAKKLLFGSSLQHPFPLTNQEFCPCKVDLYRRLAYASQVSPVLHLVFLKHLHEFLVRLVYTVAITAVDDLRFLSISHMHEGIRKHCRHWCTIAECQAKMSPSVFLCSAKIDPNNHKQPRHDGEPVHRIQFHYAKCCKIGCQVTDNSAAKFDAFWFDHQGPKL